jgi:hypothetical protein
MTDPQVMAIVDAIECNATEIPNAIRAAFISPNVLDSNLEAANIVDAISQVARALNRCAAAVEQLVETKR